MNLITDWKLIGIFFAILALGFGLHELSIWTLNLRHQHELASQATALNTRCETEKETTREVSHEYQTKLSSLNAQLARLKRVQSRCILPESDAPAGRDGATPAGQLPRSNGISTDWLIEYAGNAEETRLKLLSCQDFITKTLKEN